MINIVLVHPEIVLNTGSIVRTSLATNSKLHLIKPLGFLVDASTLKRYSANNYIKLKPTVHESWEEFLSVKTEGEMFFLSSKGKIPPSDFNLSNKEKEIFLIFGQESTGLPEEILKKYSSNVMRLPMSKEVKCVNLSNTVMTVVYESKRQDDYFDLDIKSDL